MQSRGLVTITRLEAQALETVEAVLSGRIGTVEAAQALLPLLQLNSDLASQADFNLIRAIESETDDLPVGRVRQHWHPDSLREKDHELARCEGLWHEKMMLACQRIRRTLLLRKLIVDRHVNVAERQLIVQVRRQEVVAILRSILRANSVFPEEGREGFAFEGATIGRVSSGAQIMHSRTHAVHSQTIAERRIDRYENLDVAIEAFIDREWSDGIDGILVVSTS
jgi:hypothetical protein